MFLLTPKWPGFNLTPSESDQVKVSIPRGDLNRAAVFFRMILAFPAALLNAVLVFGAWLIHLIMWFAAIFTARTPRGLHQAAAAILRLQTRYVAYILLLTPEQPWGGLFGDQQAEELTINSTPVAPSATWAFVKSTKVWLGVTIAMGIITYVGYVAALGLMVQNLQTTVNGGGQISLVYVCDASTGGYDMTNSPHLCNDGSDAVPDFQFK